MAKMQDRDKERATSMASIQQATASLHKVSHEGTRVLNCVPSLYVEDDWGIDTAVNSGVVSEREAMPQSVDLREPWWTIRDQESTGACVGFASADGLLRWHYVKAGLIAEDELTSPRFIWMANKETDEITEFPTTFIESAGTQTKSALKIARNFGCLREQDLPMQGGLWRDSTVVLYSRASQLRIESFFNLGTNLTDWRQWLAQNGPILTRLNVDDTFMNAGSGANHRLRNYDRDNTHGGHAVSLVGYGDGYFIIRNSWGPSWGHDGFTYATDDYVQEALTEAYGVVLNSRGPAVPAPAPNFRLGSIETQPLTQPRFEGITIELASGNGSPERRAAEAARTVLGARHGWRVENVHSTEPLDFDLLPPMGREHETDVSRAWEITHELKRLNEVDYAEPSFVINQDNDPNVSVPGGNVVPAVGSEDSLSPAQVNQSGLPVVELAWRDWSPLFIRAHEAWKLKPRPPEGNFLAGKTRGAGIRIGHPDSGYRSHRELWNPQVEPRLRILKDLDHDFVDDDLEPITDDGDHGLATASVIMSWEPSQSGPSPDHEITGVAPRADIVPLRVAKVRPIIPTPVLLRSGMIRLRRAIDFGVEKAGCHVFSISLGWLPNRSVKKALKRAVDNHGAIVVAAAGNHIRIVVWPAHYKQCISVAACDYRGGKWKGSSRGRRVDVTAPGEKVWKADVAQGVKKSDGTSYSTASTAGVAALWLAHWGRDYLLNKYQNVPLYEVFRYIIKRSAVRPPGWDRSKWGSGIVNAKAACEMALPEESAVRSAMRYKSKSDDAAGKAQFSVLAFAFDDVSPEQIHDKIKRITGTADTAQLDRYEDEITFHILTTPELRAMMHGDAADQVSDQQADGAVAFRSARLSADLRALTN